MSGIVRLPYSEIAAYSDLHSYDFGKRQDFLYYVERLDEKYVEFIRKREEEERRKQEANAAKTPRPGSR